MADAVSPNKKLASFKLLHNTKRVFEHPPAIAGIFLSKWYTMFQTKKTFATFAISKQNLTHLDAYRGRISPNLC